jgi:opacity protein-like surface antigen
MKRTIPAIGALLGVAACVASTAVLAADDPFGFYNPAGIYFGAGVGESTIRSDNPGFGLPGYFNDHQTAWKGIIGVRPIPYVGAEFEYIDFGQPGNHGGGFSNTAANGLDTNPRAPVLFAVGYVPIPLPYVDIFGKLGVARLTLDETQYIGVGCAPGTTCQNYTAIGRTDITQTRLAYGAGVSSKLPLGFTVRAEYERISSPFGDPDAFTVSALWTF